VNKDLADTLGNFVNRVLSFSKKRFGDEVPAGAAAGEPETKLGEEIAGLLAEYETQMEALQFRKAAAALRALWSAGNSYLEEKAPWLEIKTDPEAAALTLRTAMNLIHLYAVVSEPFIPASSAAMRAAFALKDDTATWVSASRGEVPDRRPRRHPLHRPPGPLREAHGRGPGDVQGALRRRALPRRLGGGARRHTLAGAPQEQRDDSARERAGKCSGTGHGTRDR
jgi:methionyl-tRNA synthetase